MTVILPLPGTGWEKWRHSPDSNRDVVHGEKSMTPTPTKEKTMARPIITVTDKNGVRVIAFEIPGGVTSPEEFAAAVAEMPKVAGELPVLIYGRGPVWGYAMIVHEAHPTPAVATFDPRMGYIVVATHSAQFALGSVIPDPEKAA